jgi:hypothetical protein
MKKEKRTNNDIQNITTQKTRDSALIAEVLRKGNKFLLH